MNRNVHRMLKSIILYLPIILIMALTIMPIIWALSTSLKFESDIINSDINLIPSHLTFDNFINVWNVSRFSVYFKNSILTSSGALVFVTFFSVLNGYALSRFKFKGKNLFMMMLLGGQMIPILSIIIPLFIIYKNIGLMNSQIALIITYIITQLPFSTLLMRSFIASIPPQVDEAAMIDGANRMRVIFMVITPVIIPGLIATGAFAFIGAWNDFFIAFSFITKQDQFTLNVGLKFLIGEYSVKYGSIAAGSMIAMMPPLLIFAYVQRYLVSGLASGAVKG